MGARPSASARARGWVCGSVRVAPRARRARAEPRTAKTPQQGEGVASGRPAIANAPGSPVHDRHVVAHGHVLVRGPEHKQVVGNDRGPQLALVEGALHCHPAHTHARKGTHARVQACKHTHAGHTKRADTHTPGTQSARSLHSSSHRGSDAVPSVPCAVATACVHTYGTLRGRRWPACGRGALASPPPLPPGPSINQSIHPSINQINQTHPWTPCTPPQCR